MQENILKNFSHLISYPNESYFNYLEDCKLSLQSLNDKNGFDEIEKFQNGIKRNSISELEELYTQTFDINPVSSLEVGWHLFGEQYERGAFLVECRELLRKYNIEESVELPDHMTQVLILLSKMEDEKKEKFLNEKVNPAMQKILKGFENKENVFLHLVESIQKFLTQNI